MNNPGHTRRRGFALPARSPLGARTLAILPVVVALLTVTVAASIQPLAAQEDQSAAAAPPALPTPALPADGESALSFRVALAGEAAANLAAQTRSELEMDAAPVPAAELESQANAAVAYLQTVATALSDLINEYEQLRKAGDISEALKTEFGRRGQLIYDYRNALAARATILIDAAEAKGVDISASRTYVDVVMQVDLPDPDSDAAIDENERAARQTIRRVREEPPAHERAAPWTVPLTELVAELQPLRREQIEERVDAWLKILQREIRKRIRMDIALGKTEDQQEKELIAELASEQQQTVNDTVARLQAVLEVFAKRGGDTTDARQYISNATGQRLNMQDPSVFYAQAKAWALSSAGGLKLAANFGKFLLILFVAWLISRIVGGLVRAAVRRLPDASSLLQDFLAGGSQRVVMLIGLLVAVSALGINITPLAAAIGAAGLVIGLALQGTLSNFASGILILMYRPFDVGDVVNAGGVFGKVDAMTLVSTRILTFDNQVNWVPNDSIWNNVITNATALKTRRVDMVFGIGYGDDMAQAQGIIESAVAEHPKILAEPAPTIRVNELGDNSVNFVVRPWALTGDYWDVYWDLMRSVKERFDAAGINIPYPQRDLHLSGPVEVMFKSPQEHTPVREEAVPDPTPVAFQQTANIAEPGPTRRSDEDDDDTAD